MTGKERVLAALNHKEADRIPLQDSIWEATLARWRKEGFPDHQSPQDFFDFDMRFFQPDLTPRFPVKTVERTETFILQTTPFGGMRKNFLDFTSTPEIVEWSISNKEDWKKIKVRLKPDFTRVDWASGLSSFHTAREEGKFICFSAITGYDLLQYYMKSEQILLSMSEDPAWIEEMIMTFTEHIMVMCELMTQHGFTFDGAFIYNDMGYKNGLLFSPDTYMKTHYRGDKTLYTYFHSKGMKNILHSCGNVKELIPILIDTGLDCLQPLEVKAEMDIVELKKTYGDRLAFMGGIDTRLIGDPDKTKIEEEIKKTIEAAKEGGGYIYHSDHSIPTSVSFEDYQFLMDLIKKYGIYEKKEEVPQEEPPIEDSSKPTSSPSEASSKRRFSLGFRKKSKKAVPPPPQDPVKSTPEKKSRFGFFSKKKGPEQ
jgi:uroporphyrinogen decarboxylase